MTEAFDLGASVPLATARPLTGSTPAPQIALKIRDWLYVTMTSA